MKNTCHMCMMPLRMSPTPPEREHYCSYCFKDGEFVYKGNDPKEFQKMTYKALREKGTGFFAAKLFTWMIPKAPHWNPKALKSTEE